MNKLRRFSVPHVTVANKTKAPVHAEGELLLGVVNTVGNSKVRLHDVLHVSRLTLNLLSVRAIAKKGLKLVFQNDTCEVLNKCNQVLVQGRLSSNNIYKVSLCKPIETNYVQDTSEVKVFKSTCQDHITVWHRRLAHLNPVYLNQLKNGAATGISFSDSNMSHCETCTMGKLAKQPFRLNEKRASKQLDLVHSDVCQMDIASIGQAKYFVSFLDDYSRKVFVYFIKQKSEVPGVFERFIKFAEKQCKYKLKTLRNDNWREYINATLKQTLDNLGIKHETSIAYNPQQNGRAERINRVFLDKARCLIVDSNLQKKFWREAINTAAYLSNRLPKRCLGGKTPEELWTGVKPNLSHLRIFGSKAYAHVEKHEMGKMDQKAVVFVEKKANLNTIVYLPVEESPLHTHTTPEHNQDEKSEEKKEEDSAEKTTKDEEEDDQSSDDNLSTVATRSLCPKKKPKYLDDYVLYSAFSDQTEPKSYKEAIIGPESKQWIKAIKDEYASIQKNNTWELTDLPAGCNVVGSKWIFKKKVSSDGSTKYKARLVARGFSHISGMDYQDTYSPVVRYTSLRLLFAYAAKLDLDIFHYDVDTAFLHGTLEETMYLQKPEGFVNQTNQNKVCHLKKAIYGLQQGSRV